MLVKGDKIVTKKQILGVISEGEVCEYLDTDDNGLMHFAFGEGFIHKGMMTASEYEEYFEKYEEPEIEEEIETCVTEERIEEIISNSEIKVETIYDKCTVVSCKLPNGYVIVESSACVDPENYDEETGVDICMSKIIDKVWELEGYRLQSDLYTHGLCDCDDDDCVICRNDGCRRDDDDDCVYELSEEIEELEEDEENECADCEFRDDCWYM